MSKEKNLKKTLGALKKVLASKGRLQGNFYFVGNSSASEAMLITTLATKDPKGLKAVNEGKPYRKEIKGGRFARGSVVFKDGKLQFTLRGGNAGPSIMQKALRKKLSEEQGLNFLRKSLCLKPGAEKEKEEVEASSEEEEVGELTDAELQEITGDVDTTEVEALVSDQEAIGDLNEKLQQFFEAEEDEELEETYVEELENQLNGLQALRERKPIDEDALAAAWAELAENIAVGKETIPELGSKIPAEIQETLRATQEMLGDLEDDDDSQAQLYALINDGEKRFFQVDEPEDVLSWLRKVAQLYQDGDYKLGIKMFEKEIEWRLTRAERNAGVAKEIHDATGGLGSTLGKLGLDWRKAVSTATSEMERFKVLVLNDPEVTQDPRFSAISASVNNFHQLIPNFGSNVEDALDDITSASASEKPKAIQKALGVLSDCTNQLNSNPKLAQIDSTPFGAVAVHKTLSDMIAVITKKLNAING